MKIDKSKALIYVIELQFVICIIMLALGWWLNRDYFRGVGIGLLIAWVTGALAYLKTKNYPKEVNQNLTREEKRKK